MKRKSLYPTVSIIWIVFCLVIGLLILHLSFPQLFEGQPKKIYYEPEEETK